MGYNVIFGAGKIGRGFIAHLLSLSSEEFIFVEKSERIVDLINRNKQYTINILGAPEKNALIKDVNALSFEAEDEIIKAVSKASTIFTAVGGKNLNEIAVLIAKGLAARFISGNTDYINIVTCENWKMPAEQIRKGISELLGSSFSEDFNQKVGISEAVVMRSAIEPNSGMLQKDPLMVNVQDYWELPVDAARLKGTFPDIRGIKLIEAFEGFLERKFYTYNAANGTVSYLGYIKGYEKIADAAHDKEIVEILMGVYRETSRALSLKHKFPLDEQIEFTKTSLKKLQDPTIEDFVERNARDPIRKLGPDDRLVGSAKMVMEYGIIPENLAVAIAAALYYDNPVDPIALELKNMRETKGIDCVLSGVCRIEPYSKLSLLIKDKINKLHEIGWLKNDLF